MPRPARTVEGASGHEDVAARRETVDAFHRLFYDNPEQTWQTTSWLGVPTWKCPFDLWMYQEILYEVRPDVVLEMGTAFGGSALFLASMMDLIGNGRVITVDVAPKADLRGHSRLTYVTGSSISFEVFARLRAAIGPDETVLVVLDSDHSAGHVLAEMCLYGSLVSSGSYLIVEDSNINGNPVLEGFGPGPAEAISAYLSMVDEFTVDERRERLYMSFNPGGYLQKVA